jgi:transcriptional regulator of arginine metabolism
VVSVQQAAALVIVKTITGSANAAAEAIDAAHLPEVAGTLAGDNTIFNSVKEAGEQRKVIEELTKLIGSKNA